MEETRSGIKSSGGEGMTESRRKKKDGLRQ